MARTPKKRGASGKDGSTGAVTEATRRKLHSERQDRLRRLGTVGPVVVEASQPKPARDNRDYPTPLVLGESDPRIVRQLIIPFPVKKLGAGRRFLRGIVKHLELAAATHVLRGYDLLMAREGMSAEKTLTIVAAVTPRTLDYMQRLARSHMKNAMLTPNGVDQLAAILSPSDVGAAESHLALARLLCTALTKAHRIIDEADAALKEVDIAKAEAMLHSAFYAKPSDVSRIDLVRLSAAANIDAAVLWPQYIEDMPVFEVARFATTLMLDAHRPYDKRYAKLRRGLFPAARIVLGSDSDWPRHGDVIDAMALVRDLLKSCRTYTTLLDGFECAYIAGIDLVIGEGREKTLAAGYRVTDE